MDQFSFISSWAIALFVIWCAASLAVFTWMLHGLGVNGGKVSAKEFGEPELIVCVGLIVWILVNVVTGFGKPDAAVTEHDILSGAVMFVGMVGLLWVFLQYRGIQPARQFGFTRRNPFACLGIALGLVFCVHPLMLLVEAITTATMHGKAHPQNVVEFFLNASEKSDTKGVSLMLVLAVVVAPVAEETVFRGFLYGVMKRYIGAIGAAVVSAGLFAAMHLNLAALPALFVLAMCLTVAYEATGSLLVNIFMHAFFNLSMLLMMLYLTAHGLTP